MNFDRSISRLKMKTSLFVLPLVVSSFFFGATQANAAEDIFLKIGDIKGESLDKGFEGQIRALDWSWGLSQSGTMHMGTGGGAGKAAVQDLTFTHYVDAATPRLINATASGKHFPEAVLTLRKGGEFPLSYVVVDLTDVLVTSVAVGGSDSADRATAVVSLNFAKFKFRYQPQDAKGGKAGGAIEVEWDIVSNTGTK